MIIESHGDFTDSPTLKDILTRANSDHVALLWDAHHTFATSHEEPEFTVAQLGKWIRHTHLKDSVPDGKDGEENRRYVLTGKGRCADERQIRALVASATKEFTALNGKKCGIRICWSRKLPLRITLKLPANIYAKRQAKGLRIIPAPDFHLAVCAKAFSFPATSNCTCTTATIPASVFTDSSEISFPSQRSFQSLPWRLWKLLSRLTGCLISRIFPVSVDQYDFFAAAIREFQLHKSGLLLCSNFFEAQQSTAGLLPGRRFRARLREDQQA